MLDKKTVSQCISADYCRGWNDAAAESIQVAAMCQKMGRTMMEGK